MCLIQIVIFLFAASLGMMNDGSQGGGVINGSTLALLHGLLILLLYYPSNPAGCSAPYEHTRTRTHIYEHAQTHTHTTHTHACSAPRETNKHVHAAMCSVTTHTHTQHVQHMHIWKSTEQRKVIRGSKKKMQSKTNSRVLFVLTKL